MPKEAKDFFEKFPKDMKKMKELTGDAVDGFMGMFAKIMGEGALSVREKELVALAAGGRDGRRASLYASAGCYRRDRNNRRNEGLTVCGG